MSFNVFLSTTDVYATNTAGKDYTWSFNFGNVEDGPYLLSFQFACGNISQTNFGAANGPVQVSVDFGNFSTSKLAGPLVTSTTTQIIGSLKLDFRNTSIATYNAQNTDNFPVLFKNINKNSNFIRIHLDSSTGSLITTGITPWVVMLNFKKV